MRIKTVTGTILLAMSPLLFNSCTTDNWTEKTDKTRTAGEPVTVTRMVELNEQYVGYTTQREPDGFVYRGDVRTDKGGRCVIDLLPAAMQCLHYGHTVEISVWINERDDAVVAHTIDRESSFEIIEEAHTQAKLGGEVALGRLELQLLGRMVEVEKGNELGDKLAFLHDRANQPD